MLNHWSRRSLLKITTLAVPMFAMLRERELFGAQVSNSLNESSVPVSDLFPTQVPELVREMVTVAHFDLNRVKELVEASPVAGARSLGLGIWRLGKRFGRRIAHGKQADCRILDFQGSAAVAFFGGHAWATGSRESVRCSTARCAEHPWAAQHQSACAREGRRRSGASAFRISANAGRCGR